MVLSENVRRNRRHIIYIGKKSTCMLNIQLCKNTFKCKDILNECLQWEENGNGRE